MGSEAFASGCPIAAATSRVLAVVAAVSASPWPVLDSLAGELLLERGVHVAMAALDYALPVGSVEDMRKQANWRPRVDCGALFWAGDERAAWHVSGRRGASGG